MTCQHPGHQSLSHDDPNAQWDKFKEKARALAAFYSTHQNAKIRRWGERIDQCADTLMFEYTRRNGRWVKRLRQARLCRVRTCPVCQWRRSRKIAMELTNKLAAVRKEMPNLQATLLTLTVRSCKLEDLRETCQAMMKGWSKLTRRKLFSGIVGWVRSFEVTPGKRNIPDEAHPHIHVLLLHERSISRDDQLYARGLADVMGLDYIPVCDARAVKDLDSAIPEIAKYMVKQGRAKLPWLAEVALAVDKVRAIGCGGTLLTITEDNFETEDSAEEVELPGLPVGHRIPEWCNCVLIAYKWDFAAYKRCSFNFWNEPPP